MRASLLGWSAILCIAVGLGRPTNGEAQRPASQTVSRPSDTLRITLADARSFALRTNPSLRAARLSIEVARGELRQAGVYLRGNPSADVLGGRPGAELEITQEVEIAGQRSARVSAGEAGVARASASILNRTRTTLADLDRAFYRTAAARQRENLANEVRSLNERLAQGAARQLAVGDISQLDANLATVEYGRARARALAAAREREESETDLRVLLGVSADLPLIPILDLPPGARGDSTSLPVKSQLVDSLSIDSLTAVALARRPDLRERAAAVQQASAQASVARREAFPNLVLRGSSERQEGGDGRVLRPGIGLTLPAFNRNQGEVQARRAEAQQAELERVALVAEIRATVSRAVRAYRSAVAEVDILERTVLAPARENRRLLEIAYRAGKVGLPVLLLIRNQVIDAESEYWDAWLSEREARVAISEATGETVGPDVRPR
jgi:cobalt-zinc-cadmium efflux system outer membrane protein